MIMGPKRFYLTENKAKRQNMLGPESPNTNLAPFQIQATIKRVPNAGCIKARMVGNFMSGNGRDVVKISSAGKFSINIRPRFIWNTEKREEKLISSKLYITSAYCHYSCSWYQIFCTFCSSFLGSPCLHRI